MIGAFINSESDHKTPQDPPLAPAPSVDRVLLQRATVNSRKLQLLCGRVPATHCNQEHGGPLTCYDPILVSRRPVYFLFS